MKPRTVVFKIFAFLFFFSAYVIADVKIPPESGDQAVVMANANVTIDASSQLITYSYSFTSASNSKRDVWFVAVSIKENTNIVSHTSPPGWDFSRHVYDNVVSWSATDIEEDDIVILPGGGELMSSKQSLKPGQSISGFSISTYTQSGQGTYYAQSVTVIPSADDADDFEGEGYEILPFQQDSFSSTVLAPVK